MESPAVGSEVADALLVRRFHPPPSPEYFATVVEPSNVPAVFVGIVKDWPAIRKWDPSAGGLDYLEELVGSVEVEVMLSKDSPIFYGDLRSHQRVPLPFSTFAASCKTFLQDPHITSCKGGKEKESDLALTHESCSSSLNNLEQLYLAQVPIVSLDNKERCPLEKLREDIHLPMLLEARIVSSINLWMNRARSRSSTHYDPHHNLLCVVSGCKQVTLWPPSASTVLYPMAIYGESSNHSAVDAQKPDLLMHPRAKTFMEYSQKVVVNSGDALYIPEGWFHQVDSEDLTIAVNFWWKSKMMSEMLEHMDAYYLRRILNRLLEKEKDRIMLQIGANGDLSCKELNAFTSELSKGSGGFDVDVFSEKIRENCKNDGQIQQLDSSSFEFLHGLIGLIHEAVNVSGKNQALEPFTMGVGIGVGCDYKQDDGQFCLETDPVAKIFTIAEPLELRKIFLLMVQCFPRTLEALILHVLSPVAAEVLTRKFEEIDHQTTKDQQSEFYQLFYSVFDDQYAAMDAILNRKELFAFGALRNVADHYMGVKISKPN